MWLLGAEGAVCDLHSCLGDAGGLQRQALSRGGRQSGRSVICQGLCFKGSEEMMILDGPEAPPPTPEQGVSLKWLGPWEGGPARGMMAAMSQSPSLAPVEGCAKGRREHGKRGAGVTVNGGGRIEGLSIRGGGSVGAPGLGPWRPVARRMPGGPRLDPRAEELTEESEGEE